MYFADLQPTTGRIVLLRMMPMRIKRFRINNASKQDSEWLKNVLCREGDKFGTGANVESKAFYR